MTILYVITQGEMGGAQLYVQTLAKAAKSQNWAVNVAIGDKSENWLSQETTALEGKIWPLKHLKRPISLTNDILAVFELAKLYQKVQPDIIHLNSSKAGVVGSLAGVIYKMSRPGAKIIYTVHGWVFNEPMNPLKKALYLILEKITAWFKDKIICVSEFDRQAGLKMKIAPANKLITINNGVDFPDDYFSEPKAASEKLGLQPDGRLIVGTIANFYATKGLQYLIEAVKILADDYKLPVLTVIIGDGELRPELEQQITELKLRDKIILTGSVKDAIKYLKALDIAIISSVKEGFPYFLLGAMSAGLPIVSTNVGGIPEALTDGENGFLVEPKNPTALAEKIKVLAADENLRQQFSDNNRQKAVTQFSLKEMIEKTFQAYK